MSAAQNYFDKLNEDYLVIHKTKEDLFWRTYMGTSDDHEGFAQAETAFKAFVSNANRIKEIKAHLTSVISEPESEANHLLQNGLQGWLNFFNCNAVEDQETKEALNQLIKMESDLFAKRKSLTLHCIDENNQSKEASTLVLRSNLITNKNEPIRK